MKTLYTIVFTLLFISSNYAQGLYLNLEKGKEYLQHSNSTTKVLQHIEGQELHTTISLIGTTSFLVKKVKRKGYVMDVRFVDLLMQMNSPQGTMEFDSENPGSDDIFSDLLKKMTDFSFEITLSKFGRVLDANEMNGIWDVMVDEVQGLSGAQKKQIKAELNKTYGEKAFTGNLESVTAIYPENPVELGDKWMVETILSSGMKAKSEADLKLTKLNEDYALIISESNITTINKDEYALIGGLEIKYDMNGTASAEYKVDPKSGWIKEAKIIQEMEGVAYVKGNPQMPEGLEIPMTMSSESEISSQKQ
ncbi:DUF6263 family protein [Brumimicrobium aurantiacum]|uniref:Uncharacterized protein n=1 Tax=Brumimicrobium aurantiacum TaxID=1737063 RepID=A0A3E1EVP0_9FLAO|nr:DUF6263 family protein [Brumimicrobium aurantiacum]RFC53582.1 hypothetical protein DXU93_12515 [Brumimicrobium aurantiacum]